ncbi:hypothetical protein DL98DRAFT_630261 [Cadophora sp. DSE1049]|nr:hypothetical protein DL98DRAFT_630261 [Cadophora sp. DSE1049]
MAGLTIILISGVTRGSGKPSYKPTSPDQTTSSDWHRPAQNPPAAIALTTFSKDHNNIFILLSIGSTSTADPTSAITELLRAGISRLDVVIANAGGTGISTAPLKCIENEDMREVFAMNALCPSALFQAVRPLLERSERPTWVTVTIEGAAELVDDVGYFAAFRWLIAFAVHPGLVQTEPGNHAARMMGMEKAPISKQTCADSVVRLIDTATREKCPGKFFNAIPESTLVVVLRCRGELSEKVYRGRRSGQGICFRGNGEKRTKL